MGWFIVNLVNTRIVTSNLIEQEEYSIDEEFYLFEASSKEELYKKIAKERRRINKFKFYFYKSSTRIAIDDDTLQDVEKRYFGDAPAIYKVLGIRKIYPLSADSSTMFDKAKLPKDGDFIVRSTYKVDSYEKVKQFARGEIIDFTYLEDDQINLAKNGILAS